MIKCACTAKKDFIQLFSDVQSFLSMLKDQIQLLSRAVNLSVWREDLPVLDNVTQSPRKGIKFLRFYQIQKVNASHLNLRLELKLSIQNAKRAIYLQLGGAIFLILIFILNSYNFIWKILPCHLKSVWWCYTKIYGGHAGGRVVFSNGHNVVWCKISTL